MTLIPYLTEMLMLREYTKITGEWYLDVSGIRWLLSNKITLKGFAEILQQMPEYCPHLFDIFHTALNNLYPHLGKYGCWRLAKIRNYFL
jgi:hypothetical protein